MVNVARCASTEHADNEHIAFFYSSFLAAAGYSRWWRRFDVAVHSGISQFGVAMESAWQRLRPSSAGDMTPLECWAYAATANVF
jgi:hypothetical protein